MELLAGRKILLVIYGAVGAYETPKLVEGLKNIGALIRCVLVGGGESYVSARVLQKLSGHLVVVEEDSCLKDFEEVEVVSAESLGLWGELGLVIFSGEGYMDRVLSGGGSDLGEAIGRGMLGKGLMLWGGEGFKGIDASKLIGMGVRGLGGEGEYFRLGSIESICERVVGHFTEKILAGKRVIISAGPTREALDAVTYLTNPSSGKMGMALALAAKRYGAWVKLVISEWIEVGDSLELDMLCRFRTVGELKNHMMDDLKGDELIFMSAAVGDWELREPNVKKNKKSDIVDDEMIISMKPTEDVLLELCRMRRREGLDSLIIIGFAAETDNLEVYAAEKLKRKDCDGILANWVCSGHGNAFGSDETALRYFKRGGGEQMFGPGSKEEVSMLLMRSIVGG